MQPLLASLAPAMLLSLATAGAGPTTATLKGARIVADK
jgi:hypothetical protein